MSTPKKAEKGHTIILNDAEYDDLQRMLENEERTQSDDIELGYADGYSPLITSMYGKEKKENNG